VSMNKLRRSIIWAAIHRRKNKNPIGFTLIEFVVSLVIMGILASVAIPLYIGYIDRARTETIVSDMNAICLGIAAYYTDNGKYPDSLADVHQASYPDPWGNSYQYLNIQTAKGKGKMRKDRFMVPINSDYDLYSMGKDGESQPPLTAKASRDDIIRANDGAYVGPVYAF